MKRVYCPQLTTAILVALSVLVGPPSRQTAAPSTSDLVTKHIYLIWIQVGSGWRIIPARLPHLLIRAVMRRVLREKRACRQLTRR